MQKTNVYEFKCTLGDSINENNSRYIGLNSTTLSKRLTMHLSGTSSIEQHLKYSCPKTEYRKIFTEIRGAFNKFPDFFVQAFKIGVDSWKFTMLLLYI